MTERTWFTSDLHLGDRGWPPKARYGASNIEYHETWLAKTWDERVQDGDEVWVLGDVAVGWTRDRAAGWLSDRPGRKHLVRGNLDQHASLNMWERSGFTAAFEPGAVFDHDGLRLELVHRPADATGEQVDATLHGHTHKKRQRAWRDAHGRLLVHVGWDAWRAPVLIDEIRELIEENTHTWR